MVETLIRLLTLAALILALGLPVNRARPATGPAPDPGDARMARMVSYRYRGLYVASPGGREFGWGVLLRSWFRTVLLCVLSAVVLPFSPLAGVAMLWGMYLYGEEAASTSFMIFLYAVPLGGAALGLLGSALWELHLVRSGRHLNAGA